MKNRFSFLFVLSLLSLFLFFSSARSDNTSIVINEIGAYEINGNEWIEIFNSGTESVDLSTWKFWENGTNHALALKQGNDFILDPGEFAIITQDDLKFLAKYPSVTGTILDSSWTALSEDGEDIGLKFGSGENDFVERFRYIAIDNFSLERKDPSVNDYTENNWIEHLDGNTVGQKNSVFVEPPLEEILIEIDSFVTTTLDVLEIVTSSLPFDTTVIVDASSSSSTLEIPVVVPFVSSSAETVVSSTLGEELCVPMILLNEISPNPNDEEKEWVELSHIGGCDVLLDGFTLDDAVGQIASPSGTIVAGGFFVVELKSSKLNNDGDMLVLKNINGDVVDVLSFGTWDDENILDNAPAPQKGNTLMRKSLQTTDNNAEDFLETITVTKGSENIFTAPPVQEQNIENISSNEVPRENTNNTGSNSAENFVSFSSGSLVINELLSDPGVENEEFVELYNTNNVKIDLSGATLRDAGGSVTLLDGVIEAKGFFIVEKPKGNLNNTGDQVTLLDPSGAVLDSVTYGSWNDGNIEDNAPAAGESMSLARRVDGFDTDKDTEDFAATLEITAGEKNSIRSAIVEKEGTEIALASAKLVLNEVLPNPVGDDTKNEFIEIYNPTTSTVSLLGWKIANTNSHYTIREKILAPGDYAVFLRSVTGISLRNTGGDNLQLYNALGDVVDSLSYLESAGEGQSFGRYDGFFAWSREQTLGEKNIFVSIDPPDDTLVKVREEISTFRENQSPKSTSVKKVSVAKKKTVQKVAGIKIKAGLKIALSQVREQDKGTLITTTGTVAVLPGILGTQYFYIVDDSAGVQIFMSKKDFPDIFVGDQLQITGQISESYGETRVNVQKKSQIEILGHGEMPLAQNVELANIGEPFEGALVQNTAQVTDVKSGYMYIDDGTGEIKVYFKRGSGITREDVMLGNTVVVTGIVSQMQGGYQILPRSKEDIVSLVSSTVVLGAKSDFVSSGRKEFVTVLFVAAILILFWTLLKTYKLKVTSK